MTRLPGSPQAQEVLRLEDFARPPHGPSPPDLRERTRWCFFFQPALERPQTDRGQPTRAQVMMPSWVLADFLVGQAPCGVRCRAAWRHGPAHPTAPDQPPPGDTPGSGPESIPIPRRRAARPRPRPSRPGPGAAPWPAAPRHPQRLPAAARPGPARAPCHWPGEGCDRLALPSAAWAPHLMAQRSAGGRPGKTRAPGGGAPPAFVQQRVESAPGERTLGHRTRLGGRPSRRSPTLPPDTVVSREPSRAGERQGVNANRRCRVSLALSAS
jgi:hypothetical protein